MPFNARISIIGNTVRRPQTKSAPTIHRLLSHLERKGFKNAPRFLGIDAHDEEVLSWVPGDAYQFPLPSHCWSDEALCGAAQLLRRYHDATADFLGSEHDEWSPHARRTDAWEVICHNDFAPFNCVYQEGVPHGIIDFELAAPGLRAWDLASSAYRFVPLCAPVKYSNFGVPPGIDDAARLASFIAAYGPKDFDFKVEAVIEEVVGIRAFSQQIILDRDPRGERITAEHHIEAYDEDLHYISASASRLAQRLDIRGHNT